MIRTFADDETARVFAGEVSREFPADIHSAAFRKLCYLDAARTLQDLLVPPGNRLEKLRGNREGQYSIRVNDQYRICFRWEDGDAHDVELVDYH